MRGGMKRWRVLMMAKMGRMVTTAGCRRERHWVTEVLASGQLLSRQQKGRQGGWRTVLSLDSPLFCLSIEHQQQQSVRGEGRGALSLSLPLSRFHSVGRVRTLHNPQRPAKLSRWIAIINENKPDEPASGIGLGFGQK